MPLPTPEQLLDNEDNLLLRKVRDLMKRVEQLEARANAKTNFTNAAGAHVVVGTGDLFNTANPFTGTAILFPPYVHASGNYHIFGMNNGVLQWGASADDGQLYAGGGDVISNQYGILFRNQEGELIFQDTAGGSTIALYSDAANWLVLANQFGGAGITFLLDDASHVVKQIDFDPDGSIVLHDGNIDLLAGQYLINGVAPAGTYTPTLTNTTNIDSSTVNAPFTYQRVGNFVTVAGSVFVDPTAAANTVLGISLPIASNFTVVYDGTGIGSSQLNNVTGNIAADITNDRMTLTFQAPVTTSMAFRLMFMYEIK